MERGFVPEEERGGPVTDSFVPPPLSSPLPPHRHASVPPLWQQVGQPGEQEGDEGEGGREKLYLSATTLPPLPFPFPFPLLYIAVCIGRYAVSPSSPSLPFPNARLDKRRESIREDVPASTSPCCTQCSSATLLQNRLPLSP
eukprot:Hpha_TRINITY_DN12443_c0_g1::TRINITY_DN12443_c0_g1_i2::g.42737::m.42737